MDIDHIVKSIEANLHVHPREHVPNPVTEVIAKKRTVPWNWILLNLIELLQRYPSGLSRPVVLNELQHAWELVYGTIWTGNRKRAKSHHVRHILDSCRVNSYQVIECEIRSVISLENSKETWVAELVDSEGSNDDFLELNPPRGASTAPTNTASGTSVGVATAESNLSLNPTPDSAPALPWLLHQKFYPLLPNSAQTLRRTSSRGLTHTITRARSIRNYGGAHLFVPGRKLKLVNCRLHSQWSGSSQKVSVLPNEDAVVMLNTTQEAASWPDYSEEILKSPNAKSPDGILSFKASILSLPSLDLPNMGIASQSTEYPSMFPSYSSNPPFVDVILSKQASSLPIAALRLFGPHIHLVSCMGKEDLIVLHMCVLISDSHEFASSQVSRSHFGSSIYPNEAPEPQTLRLPLFSYSATTLLMIVPKTVLDLEEALQAALDPGTSITKSSVDEASAIDLSYYGPKMEFNELQPNCFNVTLVGYVVSVSRNQPSKAGFRRHGLRLQDTQSSSTRDLTIWENPTTASSMTSSVRPGHLLLLRGLSTDLSRGDRQTVLANLTAGDSKIINLSLLEGFVTSQPADFPHHVDISRLTTGSKSIEGSTKPADLFGPFIISNCSLSPATMTIHTSLHHSVCNRSLGQPNLMGTTTCAFCCDNQVDQASQCSWQFDMDWTLESISEGHRIAVMVKAKPELSSHLLKTSAEDFLQLSGAEQEVLVLHRANYPLQGTACVSRSTGGMLLLDQFVMS